MLEERITDPHGVLGELKTALQRAEDGMGNVWQAYTTLKAKELHQKRSGAMGAGQELLRIRGQLAQYEAPWGEQA